MRNIIYALIIITSSTAFSKEKSTCHPSNISGEVTRYKKVINILKKNTSWHPLPQELSLHSGEFGRLKFLTGNELRLSYITKNYTKVINKTLDESFIADIDFIKWFDEVHTFRGGILKIELLNTKSKGEKSSLICSYNMDITGGD